MKKQLKAVFGAAVALLLVIVVGMNLSDHSLKATDGDENIVENEEVADETVDEVIDDSVIDSEVIDLTEETADEEMSEEASEETEEESEAKLTEDGGNVTITSNINMDEPVEEGQKVTLTANVDGYEDIQYHFQWSKSLDGESWEDIAGATGEKYTFTMSEDTNGYLWRVRIIEE